MERPCPHRDDEACSVCVELLWLREEVNRLTGKAAEQFSLDRAENPHPKMLAGAIEARRTARAIGGAEGVYYWAGILDAMCWATGETHEAMNAWIDRHTGDSSFDGSATRVELRNRK